MKNVYLRSPIELVENNPISNSNKSIFDLVRMLLELSFFSAVSLTIRLYLNKNYFIIAFVDAYIAVSRL